MTRREGSKNADGIRVGPGVYGPTSPATYVPKIDITSYRPTDLRKVRRADFRMVLKIVIPRAPADFRKTVPSNAPTRREALTKC